MSTVFPFFLSELREEAQALRRHWGWFLALGIALIVIGMLAISYPVPASEWAIRIYGILLLVAGAVEIASVFWARRWSGFFLHLLSGLLYLFVGEVLLEHPDLGMMVITLLLAVLFFAGGVVRVVLALSRRPAGWGWSLLSGAISVLLGLMIWRQFPTSALWVIGTFVGIDLIFNGWSWVMLAVGLRQLPAGESPK
jgi:uncharacterized membrane protein HdeD (DUF308 family)